MNSLITGGDKMQKKNSNIKRALITDTFLAVIIMIVYFAAFVGVSLISDKPALKGSTGEEKIGLQIAVNEQSDIGAYKDILEKYRISATFFFDAECSSMQELEGEGYSTGFLHESNSVPVLSYGSSDEKISTSVDLDKLINTEGWEETLKKTISGDMLIFKTADNDFEVFEKIVQIILDKGYTIVKMEEMF